MHELVRPGDQLQPVHEVECDDDGPPEEEFRSCSSGSPHARSEAKSVCVPDEADARREPAGQREDAAIDECGELEELERVYARPTGSRSSHTAPANASFWSAIHGIAYEEEPRAAGAGRASRSCREKDISSQKIQVTAKWRDITGALKTIGQRHKMKFQKS
jgi:hypothetical protein